MSNLTFGIIKPDAVSAGHTGSIIQKILDNGFKIRGLKLIHMTRKQGEGFYAVHAARPVFGGLTYAQARERANVSPLVTEINQRTGDTTYRSLIIVPASSTIQEVSELKGRNFAFGSISSTSGSLYPSIMLRDAGIDYRIDLGEKTYTGGHDATAAAVANGQVDGGGIEDRILYRLIEEGTVEDGTVRTIEESDAIEGYPWVVRDALPEDLKEEIAQAYLNIEDPTLLDLLRAAGYERVEAEDYDYVEGQARQLDLLTAES